MPDGPYESIKTRSADVGRACSVFTLHGPAAEGRKLSRPDSATSGPAAK